jgi:hypothetical protein
MAKTLMITTTPLLLIALAGCGDTSDQRLHDLARQSLAQQARQSEQLAQQAAHVAETARQLVTADSEARQELLAAHAALQEKLQEQRADVQRQLNALEEERRALAQQRGRDPIVANALLALGVTVACLLPLLLAGYVLFTVNRPEDKEAALNQVLVTELVAEQPTLLTIPADVPRRLDHKPASHSRARIPRPDSDSFTP